MSGDTKFHLTLGALAIFGLIGAVVIQMTGGSKTVKRQDVLMDTVVSLEITTRGDAKKAADESMSLIRQLDGELSMYKPESAISKINAAAGKAPVKVDARVFELIGMAKDMAAFSDGAFDPTIGPVTDLWGIGDPKAGIERVPSEAEIDEAKALVGFEKIRLTEPDTVYLETAGAKLDLGGIAKGHISDMAADFLMSSGVGSALIDLGGNLKMIGMRPDGKPWRIGIQDPRGERKEALCVLELSDTSAVTAGTYERYATLGDRRYPHIFDPRSGQPVSERALSATVISPNAAEGDALSTALIVAWNERLGNAFDILSLFPGVDALIVLDGEPLELIATESLRGRLTQLRPEISVSYVKIK